MSGARRQTSWSYNLHDDCSDQSSEEDQPPSQPEEGNGGTSFSEAQSIQRQEPELACHEVFDIGDVDEGDVKFVETPFTIARRVGASRKSVSSSGAKAHSFLKTALTAPPTRKPLSNQTKPRVTPRLQCARQRGASSSENDAQSAMIVTSSPSSEAQPLFSSDLATSNPTSDAPVQEEVSKELVQPQCSRMFTPPNLVQNSHPDSQSNCESDRARPTPQLLATLPVECHGAEASYTFSSLLGLDGPMDQRLVVTPCEPANLEFSALTSPPRLPKMTTRNGLRRFKHYKPMLPHRSTMHPGTTPIKHNQAPHDRAAELPSSETPFTSTPKFQLPTFVPAASTSSKRLMFQPTETYAQFKARTRLPSSSLTAKGSPFNQTNIQPSSEEGQVSGIAFGTSVRSVKPGVVVRGESDSQQARDRRKRNRTDKPDIFRGSSLFKW
ncbi:hypothetical protein OIV83_002124 [Microbotryomycetes sp. JL201]|nr:hypothetical protein OIV83_002124 [Microbotryomycetes sp. JL201]